jgi:hypothetical protein
LGMTPRSLTLERGMTIVFFLRAIPVTVSG